MNLKGYMLNVFDLRIMNKAHLGDGGRGASAANGLAACGSSPRAVRQKHYDIWWLKGPFSILDSVTDSIIWMVAPRPLRLKESPIFLRSL